MGILASNYGGFYLLCVFTLASSRWIDMSYVYNNKTIYWGNSTAFKHKVVFQGKRNDIIPYYSAFDITTAEHGGTHIDAPIHFAEGKWSVDEIPAEKLVGPGIVVDISTKASEDRNAQLTVADLQKWEDNHGDIPDGCIVLVFTGWGKHWPNYEMYMGTTSRDPSFYRFPGIHEDAAQWLVDRHKVNGVGIDTASVDYGKTTTFKTHQILSENNIYGLENVANLDKIPAKGATIYAFPIKIGGGSGGPVRILAKLDSGVAGSSTSLPYFVYFLLSIIAIIPFVRPYL